MCARVLKAAIRKVFNSFGIEVRRSDSRGSVTGALRQAKSIGLVAKSVIDVGAAFGDFALRCHDVFPDARYILVEPLEEYKPYLSRVLKTVPGAEHVQAVAAQGRGDVVIHVHPDLVGSSMYLEEEDSPVNGVPRIVPALSLDDITRERNLEAPFLVKIDVQGAEHDVLAGGEETLRKTEYLLLEASLFKFFKGGMQFCDVIASMKSRGFVVYEIFGLQYRPLDNALSQVDLAFVNDTGLFRKNHYYASFGQRAEQDERFELQLKERARKLGRK